jgi:type I site-specific restriction endonuclease
MSTMKTKTEKKFDCLAFKDRVQAEVHNEIRDMTVEEQVAYYNRAARTGALSHLLHKAADSPPSPEPPKD